MSELQPSLRHRTTVVSLISLSALILIAALAVPSGNAATSCKSGKSSPCSKQSSKTRFKTIHRGILVSVPHGGESPVVTIQCPRGKKVFAGGVKIAEPVFPFLTVTLSAPNESINGWSAQLGNLSTTADSEAWLSVFATCEV